MTVGSHHRICYWSHCIVHILIQLWLVSTVIPPCLLHVIPRQACPLGIKNGKSHELLSSALWKQIGSIVVKSTNRRIQTDILLKMITILFYLTIMWTMNVVLQRAIINLEGSLSLQFKDYIQKMLKEFIVPCFRFSVTWIQIWSSWFLVYNHLCSTYHFKIKQTSRVHPRFHRHHIYHQ